VSRTNNQVAALDESDIVKTDDRYLYLAANGALRIVDGQKPRVVSITKVSGQARELLVHGDRAVVYTTSREDDEGTTIQVFDVSDRARPSLVRKIDVTGTFTAGRRKGDAVHTVVTDREPWRWHHIYGQMPAIVRRRCGAKDATTVASLRADLERLKARAELDMRARLPGIREGGTTRSLCNDVRRPARPYPASHGDETLTSVVSFDLRDDAKAPTAVTFESRPGIVYAATEALYLAVRSFRREPPDEITTIHKVQLGESSEATRYIGSGAVSGRVLDSFALDERAGYLRAVTTKLDVRGSTTAVSVLTTDDRGNLVRVGASEDVAPNEQVRAARYDGDRGYVVTFKQKDPLFVFDLSEPARPTLLGALEIPGFSTYLHRIDPEHLFSVGYDVRQGVYVDGVLLQMFDVATPTAPKLLHREKIGAGRSTWLTATNHLAFNYLAARGLLALPMTICSGLPPVDAPSFNGLLVYEVGIGRGIRRLGAIDHGVKGERCASEWSQAATRVKRSVFYDDLVYSIADDRVKARRLGQLGKDVADLSLVP
jgi:hypothetical protein